MYFNFGQNEVTYKEIEKFVKKSKGHWSSLDQDFEYLDRVLDEAMGVVARSG